MKTKKTYLLRLTPVNHFFFGGENTFGYDDGKEMERNYLVNSRMYPQQTTLLGLLRFLLLQQADLLNGSGDGKPLPTAARTLIGDFGFSTKNTEGYGVIRRLSPVFLSGREGQTWLPAALNKDLRLTQNVSANAWLNYDAGNACLLERWNKDESKWKAWTSKNDLEETHVSSDGKIFYNTNADLPDHIGELTEDSSTWEKPVLFHPNGQVGIEKNLSGKTEDNAFYKQTSWRLRPDAGFAFYAELEVEESQMETVLPAADIVSFGGERSLFKLEVTSQDAGFDALTQFSLPPSALPVDTLAKVVLLSDTCLPSDAYQDCAFAITRTTPFRFHIAETGVTHQYYNLRRDPGSSDSKVLSRSERFTLLKRGSVLYGKDNNLSAITKHLTDQEAFRDIGYNYFVEVPAA